MTTPVRTPTETTAPPVEPPSYGLLSVASIQTTDGTWQIDGVEYQSDHCTHGGTVDGLCPVITPPVPVDQTATLTLTPNTLTPPALALALSFISTSEGGTPETHTLTVASDAASEAAIGVTVAGTRKALQPGQTVDFTAQAAGTVAVALDSSQGATSPASIDVTLPLTAAQDETVGIQPPDTHTVTAASDAASEFAVTIASTPAGIGGQLAPGADTTTGDLAAGDFEVEVTAPTGTTGGPVTVTVPGSAVTLAVTRQVPGIPDPDDSSHFKPVVDTPTWVTGGKPFTVYRRLECNAVGFPDPVAQARRRLELGEYVDVELHHWLDLIARMENGEALLVDGGAPLDFKQAIGGLETVARLNYTGSPVLHTSMVLQPYFQQQNLIRPLGQVQRTWLESKVAFYAGHDYSAGLPVGSPPGSFWVFATGQVRALRSPVSASESFTEKSNLRAALAERTWALDSDCLLAAALIDLTGMG